MNPTDTATRGRLDRSTMVGVAIGLADAEGIDALTIRRLAKELEVTPTALYWHFTDKQALLDALADQLWADAGERLAPIGDGEVWGELRRIFESLVGVFGQHPAIAPFAPTRVIECDAGLAITERTLDLLGRAGYDEARAAGAARFLLCAAIMLVTSQPGAMMTDEVARAHAMRQKRAALLTLPPERYPRVEAAADYLIDCDDEPAPYYELGVELIMAGLQACEPPSRSRKKKSPA